MNVNVYAMQRKHREERTELYRKQALEIAREFPNINGRFLSGWTQWDSGIKEQFVAEQERALKEDECQG